MSLITDKSNICMAVAHFKHKKEPEAVAATSELQQVYLKKAN
jgi:hypothetical protein